MTFSAFAGEFEEVCQRHDAFVEQGRLELMAEQPVGGREPGRALQSGALELDLQELDHSPLAIEF